MGVHHHVVHLHAEPVMFLGDTWGSLAVVQLLAQLGNLILKLSDLVHLLFKGRSLAHLGYLIKKYLCLYGMLSRFLSFQRSAPFLIRDCPPFLPLLLGQFVFVWASLMRRPCGRLLCPCLSFFFIAAEGSVAQTFLFSLDHLDRLQILFAKL